jgi:predicted nucleotidyltransferase component of viral defense system
VEAEDKTSTAPIRLKIEINTRERKAYDGAKVRPFKVENPWFSGSADIPAFSNEELLATKLRALLQRKKGRDLIDLSHALEVFKTLDAQKTVDLFGRYLKAGDLSISRAQAEDRMFAKLKDRNFLADVPPFLAAEEAAKFDVAAANAAFTRVFNGFIRLIPGAPWALTPEMIKQFKLTDLA